MGKDERKPYEEKALMEKNNLRGVKLTSEGYDVAALEQEELLENKRMEEMRLNINQTIAIADKGGVLPEEIFCIIHINTFVYCVSEKRYYPAEIAVSSFSLQDGIPNEEHVFHKMVKPGQLPMGYAGDAKIMANETHQIDPPTYGDDDYNIEEVFYDLKKFLETRLVGSKRLPVLYTHAKQMKMVQQVLDTWCDDFGERLLFQVYNLQYMFRVLRNAVARSNMWSSDTFSDRVIEMDKFAYSKGICCAYHDVTSVPHQCSRSVVVRYAYTICDNCCGDIDIPLVPGHHVPHSSKVPRLRASSQMSLASTNRSSVSF
ncbi:unnamed protein product [Callosobruchus maculatus]|uniref:Maelstrom domain-containing protein n=1 Tax=Callosobruchus maculatus TaxID=64391 RepID=A0A653CGN9_CALMS|nr:unnamed protein product [Callosobruchus maculatus]